MFGKLALTLIVELLCLPVAWLPVSKAMNVYISARSRFLWACAEFNLSSRILWKFSGANIRFDIWIDSRIRGRYPFKRRTWLTRVSVRLVDRNQRVRSAKPRRKAPARQRGAAALAGSENYTSLDDTSGRIIPYPWFPRTKVYYFPVIAALLLLLFCPIVSYFVYKMHKFWHFMFIVTIIVCDTTDFVSYFTINMIFIVFWGTPR